ncbi:MAG: threonine aldolase family protein [Candidatus Thalassarchaeaceae archaeon]
MEEEHVTPKEKLDQIARVARENNCASHIDGARIFNAAESTSLSPKRMAKEYDSISVCLSKGLGAPVGSVLVGSSETLYKAHRWRKMFGGGMRQAGVLAAAGIYSLENNVHRLSDDHDRAMEIARALDEMDSYEVDLEQVQTNMVYVKCDKGGADSLISRLEKSGVQALTIDHSTIRIVTHLHITDDDVQRTIAALESAQI